MRMDSPDKRMTLRDLPSRAWIAFNCALSGQAQLDLSGGTELGDFPCGSLDASRSRSRSRDDANEGFGHLSSVDMMPLSAAPASAHSSRMPPIEGAKG